MRVFKIHNYDGCTRPCLLCGVGADTIGPPELQQWCIILTLTHSNMIQDRLCQIAEKCASGDALGREMLLVNEIRPQVRIARLARTWR